MHLSRAQLEEHCTDLSDTPFFKGIIDFMPSGPLVGMVWAGEDAIKTDRRMQIVFPSAPSSVPGVIRGDFGIDVAFVKAQTLLHLQNVKSNYDFQKELQITKIS
ncbi:hypothetical protein MAM1_0104d05344, partial [Mucor ambiguus]